MELGSVSGRNSSLETLWELGGRMLWRMLVLQVQHVELLQ